MLSLVDGVRGRAGKEIAPVANIHVALSGQSIHGLPLGAVVLLGAASVSAGVYCLAVADNIGRWLTAMKSPNAMLTQQEISSEMSRDERLLWNDIPKQGILLRGQDIVRIPFGLLWTGFVFFWESQAIRSGHWFMILWGVPFMLVGLHMLIGRFFWDQWVRSKTYYGLIDQRAIIVRNGWRGSVKTIGISGMDEVSLVPGSGRRGTILFGPERNSWHGFSDSGLKPAPRFEQVEEARSVYEQILRLRREP